MFWLHSLAVTVLFRFNILRASRIHIFGTAFYQPQRDLPTLVLLREKLTYLPGLLSEDLAFDQF